MSKKLLIESWLDPDPDDRITTHDLYVAAMEVMQRIEDLRAENERLRVERDEAKEEWLREFEKRGHDVAAVERQKAIVANALMRLRDESDQLCPTQIKHIAVNALDKLREALIAVSEDDEHGPGLCITKHTLDLVHAALEDSQ